MILRSYYILSKEIIDDFMVSKSIDGHFQKF